MEDLNTSVLGVVSRPTSRNLKYEVQLAHAVQGSNVFSTFKPDLAAKANSLVGQQVTARVNVGPSKDGRFINHDLEDIGPVGTLSQMAFPAQPGTPAAAAMPAAQMAGGIPQASTIPQASPGPDRAETDARITRNASAKIAFGFAAKVFEGAGPDEFGKAVSFAQALAGQIATYSFTGSFDAQTHEAPPPVPETPQEVATQVNDVAGEGAVKPGSEIPWEA